MDWVCTIDVADTGAARSAGNTSPPTLNVKAIAPEMSDRRNEFMVFLLCVFFCLLVAERWNSIHYVFVGTAAGCIRAIHVLQQGNQFIFRVSPNKRTIRDVCSDEVWEIVL